MAMPIGPFMVPELFERETIAVMNEVCEAPCELLHDVGPADVVREGIAPNELLLRRELVNATQIA